MIDKKSPTIDIDSSLYPPIEPFSQSFFDVGDGHKVFVEQCGNPNGIPVVVLHGGPGGGCSPFMRRYFNPDIYKVILFDQRGCGRSLPSASTYANTTWELVRDIELIRRRLLIDQLILFGGSWGATLALIYAITHPENVAHMVLRSIFLMSTSELEWFYAGGAGRFFPQEWYMFQSLVPQNERHDMIAAYHRRLFSGNPTEEIRHAKAWTHWESSLATLAGYSRFSTPHTRYAHIFAKLENYYFFHAGFLEHDNWIMQHKNRLLNIPTTIVQGRYDMICPPQSAYALAKNWPLCRLHMVTQAGHALSEPKISQALINTMNSLHVSLSK